ncbi:MAG: gamma-glutamyl-gamma-aminobutyrate hydrolase family protein [Geminicoccaceae bacterium]
MQDDRSSGRRPVIGILSDVRQIGIHPFHAVGEKYIEAVANGAEALPVLIPATEAGGDLRGIQRPEDYLDIIDGLFLPGSPSNVEPRHYGLGESRPGTLHDPQRDATVLPLVRAALDRDLPLLAVCRGHQELNVVLGGTLHQHVHEQPGLMDHREPKDAPREVQYATAHPVRLTEGGLLQRLLGTREIKVNSIHGQGVDRLAEGLEVEALAPDGVVEAVRVKASTFAVSVQWHPEWRWWEDPASTALFRAFGEAARAWKMKPRRPLAA